MIIKKLINHGNSKALVIDKAYLKVAGLDENTEFVLFINPGNIEIRNIPENQSKKMKKNEKAK